MAAMTKAEFKARWETTPDGDGITLDDIADCAMAWGVIARPRIRPPGEVLAKVLDAAGIPLPKE